MSTNGLIITAAVLFTVLVLKTLLDFKLAHILVKYLYWAPVRNIFREKPTKLNGEWEIIWEAGGSDSFKDPIDRHGHPSIKQLGNYIYAEFYSQKRKYALFGNIHGGFVIGDWFDIKDKNGYFGVFQLEIINSAALKGIWLGHSKENKTIRSDTLNLKRIE